MFGRGQGGIEQALVDYCEAQRFMGHEPVALVHPQAAVRALLAAKGIESRTLSNFGAWDPLAAFRLKGMLKALSPDICIAHGNRAVSLLKIARGRRIVAALHNYKIHTQGLRFAFYPTQDLLRHAQLEEVKGQHFYQVPNLVCAGASVPLRQWHTPPVIGAMGRFVAKKDFDVFIGALALLKARGLAFEALLAGDGEEASDLKKRAGAAGLEGCLSFPGWVEDKKTFFDAIDLFCMPSRHEPFGIVLLEAMAQGLPVVATDSEGPSEILRSGIDGILTPKGDAQALADALATLLADRQHAASLARNAFDTVKSHYDLPVVAHKLDLALTSLARL
jgi:glycosyltransferase involved in cell wall biosynthesis